MEMTSNSKVYKVYNMAEDGNKICYDEVLDNLNNTPINKASITAFIAYAKDDRLMMGSVKTDNKNIADIVRGCHAVVYEIYLVDGSLVFEMEHLKHGNVTLTIELANGSKILPLMVM